MPSIYDKAEIYDLGFDEKSDWFRLKSCHAE